MMWKRSVTCIVLAVLALVIKIFSFFPQTIEKYYSTGIYPAISGVLRILLGWIPFSVGDILYGGVLIWLIIRITSFTRKLVGRRLKKPYLIWLALRIVSFILGVYIVFNLFWGLNYNRRGIADQMELRIQPYTNEELTKLVQIVVDQLNQSEILAKENRPALKTKSILFRGAIQAYQNRMEEDRFMKYRHPSVKPSLFSILGNYLGFTGYYNPFSGEAQVNTTVPLFIQPFTTCHEIGHQLGYAKENEANFAGYLSAISSSNPSFRYSANFEIYVYAASELYFRDSTLIQPLREKLNPGVRQDIKVLRDFVRSYENPLEPYIRRLYGRYLKANGQPQGLRTYDEVTAWMIAYYKKKGILL
jgi:hypothetical protein